MDLTYPILKEFAEALADDLNVAGALGAILPWAASTPSDPAAALGALNRINEVLSIAPLESTSTGSRQVSSERMQRLTNSVASSMTRASEKTSRPRTAFAEKFKNRATTLRRLPAEPWPRSG